MIPDFLKAMCIVIHLLYFGLGFSLLTPFSLKVNGGRVNTIAYMDYIGRHKRFLSSIESSFVFTV